MFFDLLGDLLGNLLGNLLGSLGGSLGAKRYDTLKNISLYQFRDTAIRIIPTVFKKISHPGTQLVSAPDLLEETGNHRILGKG